MEALDENNPTVAEVISTACWALKQEILAAKQDPLRNFEITNCNLLAEREGVYVYTALADLAVPILPESPIKVTSSTQSAGGSWIAQDEFAVLLAVREFFGERMSKARVNADASFILAELAKRLAGCHPTSHQRSLLELVSGIRQSPLPAMPGTEEEISVSWTNPLLKPNTSQKRALSRIMANKVHYIWGPPGTGKTACVAQAARMLTDLGERVMVLSHANAAVDAAMLKIADACEETELLREGKILRIGIPQLGQLRERKEVLPEGMLAKTEPDLLARRTQLEFLRKRIIREFANAKDKAQRALLERDLTQVREELKGIQQRISEIEQVLIDQAAIIGLTASRLVILDSLWAWPADAVLVDEVSMVSFPFILAAALKADKRLVLFGDFRQLPPVVVSNDSATKIWLGSDAFERAGIKAKIDKHDSDPRMTLLETQYRMHPSIGEVVNKLAYSGRLTTAKSAADLTRAISALPPFPGEHIVLIDTSDLQSVCLKEQKFGSHSRFNPLHASLAVTLIDCARRAGCKSMAVISPYKAQISLFQPAQQLLSQAGQSVSSATVHRFQGSEQDFIVFDFVDAFPQRGASRLTGKDEELALRLLNVALSRARGKLIVLADVPFIEKYHPPRSPARKVLALVRQAGRIRGSHDVLMSELAEDIEAHGELERNGKATKRRRGRKQPTPATGAGGRLVTWLGSWDEAQQSLLSDLSRLNDELVVNFTSDFVPGDETIRRLAKLKNLRLVFAPMPIARMFEETAIDVRLMSKVSCFFVLFRDRSIYIGGRSPSCPIARIEDASIARGYEKLFLDTTLDLPAPNALVERELSILCGHCPDCGEERRPVFSAASEEVVVCCAVDDHAKMNCDSDFVQALLHALRIRCRRCKSQAAVTSGNKIRISCPNEASGCQGSLPTFEDLFGNGW
ncbi:MAG TPA: AAA domain-containing protein [Candidatus Obscuribacterales bacterium]